MTAGIKMRLREVPPSGTALLTDSEGDAALFATPGDHFLSGEDSATMEHRPAAFLADDRTQEGIARQG